MKRDTFGLPLSLFLKGKISKKVECNLGGYFLVWEGSHKVHEGICREEVNGSADPEYWKA